MPLRLGCFSLLNHHMGTKGKHWHSASLSPQETSQPWPCCSCAASWSCLLASSCSLAAVRSLQGPYGDSGLTAAPARPWTDHLTLVFQSNKLLNLRPAVIACKGQWAEYHHCQALWRTSGDPQFHGLASNNCQCSLSDVLRVCISLLGDTADYLRSYGYLTPSHDIGQVPTSVSALMLLPQMSLTTQLR